uniref:U17-Eretoxin-Ek1e_1 n=1 Tax=Eresus cinnaberinus TaxID=175337 RepID=A0A2D0PCE4_ERECI
MNSKICILIFLVAAVAIATSEKHCPMPRDLSSCTLKYKKMIVVSKVTAGLLMSVANNHVATSVSGP